MKRDKILLVIIVVVLPIICLAYSFEGIFDTESQSRIRLLEATRDRFALSADVLSAEIVDYWSETGWMGEGYRIYVLDYESKPGPLSSFEISKMDKGLLDQDFKLIRIFEEFIEDFSLGDIGFEENTWKGYYKLNIASANDDLLVIYSKDKGLYYLFEDLR